MTGCRAPRRKGGAFEREVVALLRDLGLAAERVPGGEVCQVLLPPARHVIDPSRQLDLLEALPAWRPSWLGRAGRTPLARQRPRADPGRREKKTFFRRTPFRIEADVVAQVR